MKALTLPMDLDAEKRAKIRLLICDVDGVLTDGILSYTAQGEEIKHFNVKDGLGIRLLMEFGVEVAIITARDSKPLKRRVQDLGIKHFYPGQDNKIIALQELLKILELEPEQIAYIGDDILDLPIMRRIGIAITVADGHRAVKQEADAVTELGGGRGAVREVTDALLDAHQSLEDIHKQFLATKLGSDYLTTA
jgi:3-deoxy-D-manno-octulosonate 8-phosphate phosphatase (KDO 8-P phosphatase)